MKIEARISDRMMADGIAAWIVMRDDGRVTRVLRPDGDFMTWDEVPEPLAEIRPTFTLEGECARALLDALLRHYQGASDMHTVRADLLHERGRVDRLTDAVIRIASGAGKAAGP